MKLHQRIGLIIYLTILILITTGRDTAILSEGWSVVVLLTMLVAFNMFLFPGRTTE